MYQYGNRKICRYLAEYEKCENEKVFNFDRVKYAKLYSKAKSTSQDWHFDFAPKGIFSKNIKIKTHRTM